MELETLKKQYANFEPSVTFIQVIIKNYKFNFLISSKAYSTYTKFYQKMVVNQMYGIVAGCNNLQIYIVITLFKKKLNSTKFPLHS